MQSMFGRLQALLQPGALAPPAPPPHAAALPPADLREPVALGRPDAAEVWPAYNWGGHAFHRVPQDFKFSLYASPFLHILFWPLTLLILFFFQHTSPLVSRRTGLNTITFALRWYNIDHSKDPAWPPLRILATSYAIDIPEKLPQKQFRLAFAVMRQLEQHLSQEHRGRHMSALPVANQTPLLREAFSKLYGPVLRPPVEDGTELPASAYLLSLPTVYDHLHPSQRARNAARDAARAQAAAADNTHDNMSEHEADPVAAAQRPRGAVTPNGGAAVGNVGAAPMTAAVGAAVHRARVVVPPPPPPRPSVGTGSIASSSAAAAAAAAAPHAILAQAVPSSTTAAPVRAPARATAPTTAAQSPPKPSAPPAPDTIGWIEPYSIQRPWTVPWGLPDYTAPDGIPNVDFPSVCDNLGEYASAHKWTWVQYDQDRQDANGIVSLECRLCRNSMRQPLHQHAWTQWVPDLRSLASVKPYTWRCTHCGAFPTPQPSR